MSKIFRLHKGGSDSIIDWMPINGHISETQINTIEDPAGDNAKKQITSIPSPFARMDLVRTAFKYIVAKKAIDGNTIYHRIVSEAFDVAEIFFNADSLQNKIEIIPWDAGITLNGNDITINDHSDLGKLQRSGNRKHRLFADTLKMFLLQDKDAYNFGELKRIFLINYKAGPEKMNIIGGTSPATLFFSSANDDICKYANIQFGEHKVFDDKNYYSIVKRSEDFIRFCYALRQYLPGFPAKFKDIDDYLNLAFTHTSFPAHLKDEIRDFTSETYNRDYEDIKLGTNEGYKVEILGYPLKGFRQNDNINSDFEIGTKKNIEGKKPLVLPNEPFNRPLNYVNGKWRTEYKSPNIDSRPLETRTLPHQEHKVHPYLTVSDFLEPFIIRLPYPVNKDKYFNGNFEEKGYGYVLPLKKEIFKYFTINELRGNVPDGRKFFELVKQAGDSVEAILRIPIRNNDYIKFSRLYTLNQLQDAIPQPDEKENKGIIMPNYFGLTIYPFLKTGKDDVADYRVQLVDSDLESSTVSNDNNYQLLFYKENNVIDEKSNLNEYDPRIRSSKKDGDLATSMIYVVQKEFELIEVKPNNFSKGIIVPLLPPFANGANEFHFAVDFGTTNTHIEYKVGKSGEPKPFEIDTDIQIGSLHANNTDTETALKSAKRRVGAGIDMINDAIPLEFFPGRLGKKEESKFPVRTVINQHKKILKSLTTFTIADYNIPFIYEKKSLPIYSTSSITSNLKWTNFNSIGSLDEKRVKAFIEKLIIMMKNKVIMNNGNLEETKLTWFYPSSMPEGRRNALGTIWDKLAAKHISANCVPKRMSESIAPFYYLKKRGGVYANKPMASIDIGGGTTDIVLYKNEPTHLTSFKYAANSIFGDGYNSSFDQNGFIRQYLPQLEEIFNENDSSADLNELKQVMGQIEAQKNTIELISFFFSLESHKYIVKNELDISFSNFLKGNKQLKVVFVFFYAAIVYHLAKLMKVLQLEPPSYITFSGTGSKVVNIIDTNPALKNLAEYTNLIFSDVYQQEVTTIRLVPSDDPKELTCKGGLFCETNFEDIEQIKTVLVGDKENSFMVNPEKAEKTFAYEKVQQNGQLLASVKKEVENFIDKFFQWHDKCNYLKKFDASPTNFEDIKKLMKEDLDNALLEGLNERLSELDDSKTLNIEEPLFFYPLVGAIHKIAQQIPSLV